MTSPLRTPAGVRALDCPFCASSGLEVVEVEESPRALSVHCPECGATGPVSLSDDPKHAMHAWNQRLGRMSRVRSIQTTAWNGLHFAQQEGRSRQPSAMSGLAARLLYRRSPP